MTLYYSPVLFECRDYHHRNLEETTPHTVVNGFDSASYSPPSSRRLGAQSPPREHSTYLRNARLHHSSVGRARPSHFSADSSQIWQPALFWRRQGRPEQHTATGRRKRTGSGGSCMAAHSMRASAVPSSYLRPWSNSQSSYVSSYP
jgi:hypothetical protein